MENLELSWFKYQGRDWVKSLSKYGAIQFEPNENTIFFKKFFSKRATNLVKILPIAPNIINSGTSKDYYTSISNNKKRISVIQCSKFSYTIQKSV